MQKSLQELQKARLDKIPIKTREIEFNRRMKGVMGHEEAHAYLESAWKIASQCGVERTEKQLLKKWYNFNRRHRPTILEAEAKENE